MSDPGSDAVGPPATVLSVDGDFDADAALRWLAAHTTPGVDAVEGGRYRRTMPDGTLVVHPVPADVRAGQPAAVRVHLEPAAAESATLSPATPDLRPVPAPLLSRVRFVLDLDRDLDAVQTALRQDPVVGALVDAQPGLRVIGGWSPWETLVRVVLGQQVSVAGARTLAGRLAGLAGRPVGADTLPAGAGVLAVGASAAGPGRLFPGPEEVAAADLGAVGLTGARRRALTALAEGVADGRLASSPDDHPGGGTGWLADLSRQPGIGPWTLSYLAMRVLRDADAWPSGDLVLRRACAAYGLDAQSGVPHLRPWRAYAATHLWEATWMAARTGR